MIVRTNIHTCAIMSAFAITAYKRNEASGKRSVSAYYVGWSIMCEICYTAQQSVFQYQYSTARFVEKVHAANYNACDHRVIVLPLSDLHLIRHGKHVDKQHAASFSACSHVVTVHLRHASNHLACHRTVKACTLTSKILHKVSNVVHRLTDMEVLWMHAVL